MAVIVALAVFAALGAWRLVDHGAASKGDAAAQKRHDAAVAAECLKLLSLPLGSPAYDHARFERLGCASR